MLTVIAKITAKEGREEEIKRALSELIAPTLLEEGCIDYILHQSNDDPKLFFFYENWTDKDFLEKHLASTHISEFSVKAEELVEMAELSFLSKV